MYWLGGTDFGKEGAWYWDNTGKQLTYNHWGQNQPIGGYGLDCLLTFGYIRHHEWVSANCDSFFGFLCEKN
ncbi:hypothetical protein FSP39_010131 [Pinctada imbricata]|uniref:C-type lectin domain-containing protein n=1 Tax=Pinctada imbricata TaxID=66713 RepID=A0AA88YDT3_PINIB|nr:hypothetical protein FSP39_010131 [Pinctada imbricata]